jgi:serine/threonine-protein kinase HipA
MSAGDLLLATGDERVGCLAFSQSAQPPAAAPSFLPFGTRAQIAEAFDRIVKGEDADPKFLALYRAGASLGGVRPKAVVEHDGQLWIAKFARHDDDIDERFDRSPAPGFFPTGHFISALSLLDLEETSMAGSYAQVAGVLRRHGAAHLRDREELFRRMLFNVLCGNRDDHLKNHALLYDADGWRLSPTFDVVPQTGIVERVQAIDVGALGGIATIENCVSRCGEFGLPQDAAQAMGGRMIERMRNWRDAFRALDVPAATIDRLGQVFAPDLATESA